MSSQCVLKLPHSCGSGDGLQVFEEDGELSGYCFSCGSYIPDPMGEGKTLKDIPKGKRLGKSKEEVATELKEIGKCTAIDRPDRRLKAKALDYFGIKVGVSEQDGKTPTYDFYPYTKDGEVVAYKVRHIGTKRMWSVGDQKNVDLFGWDKAIGTGSKRLIICEGEIDAASIQTILQIYTKREFKDHMPAVCSLAHGASSASRDLSKAIGDIRKHFKEISFCFDNDKAGQQATEDACKVIPEATVISLPCKDANECIVEGKGKAAFAAITFNATTKKNTSLVFGDDLHEKARLQAKDGELSWPWDRLNRTTRGIRYGETIYIGAGVKLGKSEVVNALAAHFIKEHKVKVFMAKPEEANNKTYKLLAGKIVGKVFHDPNVDFDYEAYDKAGEVLRGKLCLVNLYQHLGWDTLKADIIEAAGWGAKAVFIDPITNLTNGVGAADANVALQGIAQELAAMAKDLGLVVFIFCHLKSPVAGPDHENGGHVLSSQFAGSRGMMRSCNLMLGLEGNKSPDLPPEEKNMRDLVLLEDREFGESGRFNLFWDKSTGLFSEINDKY